MDKCSDRSEELNNKSSKSSKTIILNGNRSSDEDKYSLQSLVCRVCFDDNKEEPIITPCHCKGTVAYVHKTCLEKWLSESNTTSCELCHHVYETERIPKYSVKQSVWQWLFYQPQNVGFQVRRIRGDLLTCAILTPLAILVTYVCLFSADYYNQQKFSNIPVAKWTSICLLIMIALLLFGYYIWVYIVVGYHGRTWYYWWQRECIVRYIPPVSTSCCELPSPVNNPIETSMQHDAENAVVIYVNSLPNVEGAIPDYSENDETTTTDSKNDNVTIPIDLPEASTAFRQETRSNSFISLDSRETQSEASTQRDP